VKNSANNEWWQDGPWWVEYAKQQGAHRCICPVCDREHEPSNGGMYAELTEGCEDEEAEACEEGDSK
jgi:hypothetical protein